MIGDMWSVGKDINNSSQAVFTTDDAGLQALLLWGNGMEAEIIWKVPDFQMSYPEAINDLGQVVGWIMTGSSDISYLCKDQ